MKLLLKNNLALFILFGAFVIGGGIVICCTRKEVLHLFFNSFVTETTPATSDWLNTFFSNITYLGDGLFVGSVILVSLFINCRFALSMGLAYAFASTCTQVLKLFAFDDSSRPKHFFYDHFPDLKLKFIEGIEVHGRNSFPSGHTTAAFALFFSLGLVARNSWVKALCFVTALTIGLSRVYLSQHFFEDIYAGSIIGTLFSVLACYVFYFSSFSGKFNRLDAPVFRLKFSEKK